MMGEEIGKPRDEAWLGDVVPLLSALRWLERRGAGVLRRRRLGGTPWFLLGQGHWVERVPLGRVGIIATWNYPVQLVGIELAQAVVAGNRVVVKPSERCPRTQGLLLDLAEEALDAVGLGRGAGAGRVIGRWEATREGGAAMLREERFDHVVFTGSTAVGTRVAEALAPTLTGSTLELSGRDSALVLEDADVGLAAGCVWEGVRFNHGQTCMAPRRALVVGEAWDGFVREIEALAGAGEARGLIDEGAAERVRGLAREAARRGARVVPAVGADEVGVMVRGRAVIGEDGDSVVFGGDHFGPLLSVVRCADEAEALALHDRVGQRLATSVFTRDAARGRRLALAVGSSQVTVNDVLIPTAHPGAALGGRGESGWGESRGVGGLLAMTREVHVSSTPARLRLPRGALEGKRLDRVVGFARRWYGGRVVGAGSGGARLGDDRAVSGRARSAEGIGR